MIKCWEINLTHRLIFMCHLNAWVVCAHYLFNLFKMQNEKRGEEKDSSNFNQTECRSIASITIADRPGYAEFYVLFKNKNERSFAFAFTNIDYFLLISHFVCVCVFFYSFSSCCCYLDIYSYPASVGQHNSLTTYCIVVAIALLCWSMNDEQNQFHMVNKATYLQNIFSRQNYFNFTKHSIINVGC